MSESVEEAAEHRKPNVVTVDIDLIPDHVARIPNALPAVGLIVAAINNALLMLAASNESERAHGAKIIEDLFAALGPAKHSLQWALLALDSAALALRSVEQELAALLARRVSPREVRSIVPIVAESVFAVFVPIDKAPLGEREAALRTIEQHLLTSEVEGADSRSPTLRRKAKSVLALRGVLHQSAAQDDREARREAARVGIDAVLKTIRSRAGLEIARHAMSKMSEHPERWCLEGNGSDCGCAAAGADH